MRIVAVLSVAFVVLVGVVAVTYPNESDEVRQRNAAFMKLGDIKGEVKADPEQNTASVLTNPTTCTRTFTDTTAKNKAATELKRDPIFRARIACVCQDLNQISRILDKLDAKNPVAADLRMAVERAKNNLAVAVWTDGNATSYQDASAGKAVESVEEDRPSDMTSDTDINDVMIGIEDRADGDFDANDMVFKACGVLLDNVNVGS